MSSMDIDTSDEKENTSAMASPKTDAPLDQSTEMEDLQSGLTKEKVDEAQEKQPSPGLKTDQSCDECQERGIKSTHVEDANTAPRREYVPDSDDDSSVLSDVPSPVLSRDSISEMSRRKSTDHTTERGGEMDADLAEPEKEEEPQFPSNPDGDKEDDALPPSWNHTYSPSPSSSIKLAVDKEGAKVDAPIPDSNKAADNAADSISSGSAAALLLTPGSGAESVSNRALSPLPTIETESKPVEPEPRPAPEPEPEPVPIELTADEKEALMTLNAELSTVPVAVARAAVREHALKCLVGSKADEIIFMDAIFSQASDDVIRKFIDSNATRILEVANKHSKPFLDRALEIRVEDIDGKKLAGYLARAERLGFEEQDDIDGESALPVERNNVQAISSDPSDNDGDHRMQYMQPPAGEIHGTWQQPPPGYMHNPAYPSPYYVQQNQGHPPGMKVCHKCGAAFKQNAGLRYHLEKDVCKKAGVPQGPVMARCESCGKEFRSPGGYHYHMTNNVCGVRNSASPQPEGQAQNDQGAALTGQQPQAKEEEKVGAAAPPVVNQTPVQAALPHMFQNTQQQPYQGPYQNPPPQEHIQRPPMPDRIVPSMNGTPQPTAASGEQIVNTNGLLTPAQAQKLNEDLRAEDIKYAQQLKNIDPALQGAALDLEVKRLKAGMSTRKSNLRRKHGIFVRKTDKVAANAVRNEDGSIDIAPAGKTIVSGAGFAPVNHRPEAPAASPAPQRASRGPESPPSGMPDAKRRRVSEHPQQHPQQHPQPQPQPPPMASSPYGQGPMGYPPNYNMHPGSYDPRQPPHMMQGPYQQYSMSPYSQPSPYQQQPPMHPPYGQPPGYQMNTIIRAPGAPVPTQSPSPAMQGSHSAGYFPPSGFVSVNQPPPPTPPAGYMLVASPAPQQHYPVQNGQSHGHLRAVSATSEKGGDGRGSSSGPVENGKSRPKVPTDNAEKVWKAKQRDWVVQTGPQEAFKRMEKNGKEGSQEQDGEPKKEKVMKKKEKTEKTEVLVMDSDDEDVTDEDESARRPSNAANRRVKEKETAEDKVERERRELSTSSELSDLDESALMGAGEGGEPVIIQRASEDSAPQEAPKPARKKPGPKPKPKNQPLPAPQTSGFQAVNATRFPHNPGVDDYDSDEISNARPPVKKLASSRAPAPARHQQSDGGNDEDLEPENEILQVASEDEMQVDTPPSRRRAAAPAASSSAPPPGSSSTAGTPGSADAPGRPKKRLGRPVGWKKGMGGYRELLDAGVVHHNPEGTPNSRRRAEKRAAERALRRQTEGDGDAGGDSSGAGGSRAAGGRQSMG